MEHELRFGLDLGRLAVLKKKGSGPIMSNFLGWFFQLFVVKSRGEVFLFGGKTSFF